MRPLSARELDQLIFYVKEFTGIALDQSKAYLIESRLKPVMETFQITSFAQLINELSDEGDSALDGALIDAITTNETYFFRDVHPFGLLKGKLLPDVIENNKAGIVRIASAACSTGQEAYSIAMTVDSMGSQFGDVTVRIEGYDISQHVLDIAHKGEYSKFEVERGLSEDYIRRYFNRVGNRFQISEKLRAMVFFHRLNLLKKLGAMPRFHIIFCRNVINYFEISDRIMMFEQLADIMMPRGRLIIGATESLPEEVAGFRKIIACGSCFYEKN